MAKEINKPMKNSTDRHELILRKLQENGRVGIQELSDLTRVSGVTIRKDLKLLEDKNLLFRTRGGGSITNPYTVERPINEKELINDREKQQIAKAALSIIGENDSIIIGSGTTVFALARCLHPAKHLTVITPALKVALELCNRPNVEVLQLGGMIRQNSSSVAGSLAEQTLAEISCGILFLGIDGIDPDFGLSITNMAEASLNQKMIESAQVVAILADSTKFGRRGLGKVCDFDQVQYIITDAGVSPGMVKQLEEREIKVIIAG
ncbi:DeoR/GlpR family DNA-binding transcription regulator [Compostibacter hankyongensis]|uniref:Transcriptional repressor AgaR n=1 Tax=Compostibacter hankyongensis TaxID=1007089 RepID=A0ABP8FV77_9BACT